jgi:putative hemolysin
VADRWLDGSRHRHPELRVGVRETHRAPTLAIDEQTLSAFRPPRLFASYLRYGSQVLGGPALDREFGTTDFFVLCDLEGINPRLRRLLVEG